MPLPQTYYTGLKYIRATKPRGAGRSRTCNTMSQSPQEKSDPPVPKGQKTHVGPLFDQLNGLPLLIGNESAENTDDQPTIISKQGPSESNGNGPAHFSELYGRSLAHFELIEPIGVGGMAAVLRARDRQLDRIVALKILPPDMAEELENVRRFHQEARAAAKLDHENIARVFYCGEDQGLHFIAFEFVEGENLRNLLEKKGKIPVSEAIHYMLQISAGLVHAADRNVVHRDIKPSNIIITPSGRAKLVDMGLARSQEPHNAKGLTQSGVTLGTFDYISPEQALEPRDADVRSDIYSLGCTFYHAITGRASVPEGTAAKKLHHHQHVAPVDPRQLNPSLPDSVAVILARMMAKNPKDRYPRPEPLVQHLLEVAQELGTPMDTPEGLLYVDAPLPSPNKKRPGLMLALAFSGLIAVLILLSFAPTNSKPVDLTKDLSPDKLVVSDQKVKKKTSPPKPNVVPQNIPQVFPVADEAGLVTAIEKANSGKIKIIRIQLEKDIVLTRGLAFKGNPNQLLILESKKKHPAKIEIEPSWVTSDIDGFLAALKVSQGKAFVKNIHFSINSKGFAGNQLAGLGIVDSPEVKISKCIFNQTPAESTQNRDVASLALKNSTDSDKHQVILDDCWFIGGKTAIDLDGPVHISPTNNIFGPHLCLFRLHGVVDDSEASLTRLSLDQCSAIVNDTVFRIEDQVSCEIDVQRSVLSNLESGKKTHLIHQTAGSEPNRIIRYSGKRNGYHNLTFWVRPTKGPTDDQSIIYSFDDFKKTIGSLNEQGSTNLEQNPFVSVDPLSEPHPKLIFPLKEELPELRQLDSKGNPTGPFIGAISGYWGPMYEDANPPLPVRIKPEVVQKKLMIVDPNEETEGAFRTISAAISDAKSGEKIQIKHNGILDISSPVLLDNDQKIILSAFPGYHPVLSLSKKSREVDPKLFHIKQGNLQFENLSFQLRPWQRKEMESVKSLTLVLLNAEGNCSFKNCRVNLERNLGYEVPTQVIFLDSKKRMKTEPIPRIQIQNCFIRGEGHFLVQPKSGPFFLEANNSVALLSGSFLKLTGNIPVSQESKVKTVLILNRLTTLLSGYLMDLEDNLKGKGLYRTEVDAKDCLFASGNDNSLIYLKGVETRTKTAKQRLFGWIGEHNAYCGYFGRIMEQLPPPGLNQAPEFYDNVNWEMEAGERVNAEPGKKTRFIKGTLEIGFGERSFSEIEMSEIREKIEQLSKNEIQEKTDPLISYGANLRELQTLFSLKRSKILNPRPE